MAGMPNAQVTQACLQATFGDMVIMLLAYGAVAVVARGRRWVVSASGWQLALFMAIGVVITAGIEWLATRGHWVQRWAAWRRCRWCLAPVSWHRHRPCAAAAVGAAAAADPVVRAAATEPCSGGCQLVTRQLFEDRAIRALVALAAIGQVLQ